MTDRKTVLVTGASRGIGRAIARRLAADHDVVAVARSEPALRALAAEVEGAGSRCLTIPLDIADAAAVERALGGVDADVLVNNAGVGHIKPLLELSLEEWREMVDVNFNGMFHVTRAVLPGMIRRGRGEIVNIGSLAGRNTFAGGTCYAGTKHAVVAFSESLMLEVRQHGVRVSMIMPGSVATELRTGVAMWGSTGAPDWMLQPEDVAAAVAYIVSQPSNAHVSRVEMRPSRPRSG
jgi:3-oxoacyl-[acyl-carrier protein] reductase